VRYFFRTELLINAMRLRWMHLASMPLKVIRGQEQPDGLLYGLVHWALGLAGRWLTSEAAHGKSYGKSSAVSPYVSIDVLSVYGYVLVCMPICSDGVLRDMSCLKIVSRYCFSCLRLCLVLKGVCLLLALSHFPFLVFAQSHDCTSCPSEASHPVEGAFSRNGLFVPPAHSTN